MNGAVILDVDGTLVDSNDAHARAWADAFGEYGITVPFDAVRRAIGMGGDKLMPHVAGIEEDSAAGRAVVRRRSEIFRTRYLPHIRAFPGARELTLRFKKDGFVLAVASSAKAEELDPLLTIAGVIDLIDGRTSSDDAENSKPDPDIVESAMRRVRADRSATAMLGDTPYDVEAATRARIPIVALECGGWRAAELRGAVEVYKKPLALLAAYDRAYFSAVLSRIS
jgi:phosphoglycolate phosphatase-like HAD superfamily hydrolase